MADTIAQQIAEDIKTALEALSTYGGTPTVERERRRLYINGRFPFIELCGPFSEVDTRAHEIAGTDLHFGVRYFINENDESTDADTEITYLVRNVAGDIIKKLMETPTWTNRAQYTFITDYGYDFDWDDSAQDFVFYVYVIFYVHVLIDATDPYQLG
jgi:hypothetical protein